MTVQAEITGNAAVENADTNADAENAVAPEKNRSGRHTLECVEFRLCRTRFDSLTFFRRSLFILTLRCWLIELLHNSAVFILPHSGSLRQDKFVLFLIELVDLFTLVH